MNDLISRQQAIDKINERQRKLIYCLGFENDAVKIMDIAKSIITTIPSVQPERKTGHWIPVTNGRGGHQCDRCGSYAPSYQSGAEWLSNFCPECNADMRGKEHE